MGIEEDDLHTARILSSVAATVISLACGTNYGYSAWAPQFADRLSLSAFQSNIIGLAGNLGMYAMGIPIGILVDSKGPRPAVAVGAFLLAIGYYPLHVAYENGHGSVTWMCIFSFFSGLGGCTASASAIKTSALNWPNHRGTATAFPLAAFGLSAFFFSIIGSVFFPGSPGRFLMVLAVGTSGLTLSGFFFLRVLPPTSPSHYQAVSHAEPSMTEVHRPYRTSLHEPVSHRAGRGAPNENGRSSNVTVAAHDASGQGNEARASHDIRVSNTSRRASGADDLAAPMEEALETSSLVSRSRASSASSLPGEVLVQSSVDMDRSHHVDIRGAALLTSPEFWQLFVVMGILAGIGLMTINNIGNSTIALWSHYDDSIDEKTIALQQQLHVSILSLGSFAGRLLSGVGSDFLVRVVNASRIWCLVLASAVFFLAQICALNVVNPHFLGLVSGLSGLGYGFLFGVFPSITAESFGIHGLSQNWGAMTLAPVVSSNIFNLFFGAVFDAHSVVEADGTRFCTEGIDCYRTAYVVTLCACAIGFGVTLWLIKQQWASRIMEKAHPKD